MGDIWKRKYALYQTLNAFFRTGKPASSRVLVWLTIFANAPSSMFDRDLDTPSDSLLTKYSPGKDLFARTFVNIVLRFRNFDTKYLFSLHSCIIWVIDLINFLEGFTGDLYLSEMFMQYMAFILDIMVLSKVQNSCKRLA